MKYLYGTKMFKITIIFSFNIASIIAMGTTVCEIPETYFEWKIEKFFDLPTEINYFVESPKFPFANSMWHLQIFPNGQTKSISHEYIGVYLWVNDCNEKKHVDFKIGFKRPNCSDFAASKTVYTFSLLNNSWGWAKFIKKTELLNSKDTVAPMDTLTVFCKVGIVNSTEVKPEIKSTDGVLTLTDNLMDLYKSKRFTDITLIVQNREFYAHKNILSCRLEAFGSMIEKILDKFEITDCDPDSFEEFLLFVYTGKLYNVSSKKAMSLYLTADKYNMPELKKECTRSLVEQDLNINSFNDILRFAVLQRDTALMSNVTEFFISYAKYIVLNENWKAFLSEYPLQGNELFSRYIEKKN